MAQIENGKIPILLIVACWAGEALEADTQANFTEILNFDIYVKFNLQCLSFDWYRQKDEIFNA